MEAHQNSFEWRHSPTKKHCNSIFCYVVQIECFSRRKKTQNWLCLHFSQENASHAKLVSIVQNIHTACFESWQIFRTFFIHKSCCSDSPVNTIEFSYSFFPYEMNRQMPNAETKQHVFMLPKKISKSKVIRIWGRVRMKHPFFWFCFSIFSIFSKAQIYFFIQEAVNRSDSWNSNIAS